MDLLLIVWFVLGLAGFVFCLVMLRRSQRRIEKILAGPRGGGKEVRGAVDPKPKAVFSVDERAGVFRWEGQFEGKQATYSYDAETGYSRLQMATGSDVLIIAQFDRERSSSDVPSPLPYKVEINGRTIYWNDLLAQAEGWHIRRIVEAYFVRGVQPLADQLPAEHREALETLLFGHHTFRRFLEYLTKDFPDFITQIRKYRGKPLSEMLAVFKAEAKSKEELLIEMKGAVAAEDFPRAAAIRDQLKALEAPERPGPQ